jgi:DNA-binding CsgD family transcriptional regulator
MLDRSPSAILLLDERGRIVYANRGAEALNTSGDGIKLTAAGIALLQERDHRAFQCLLAQTDGVMRVNRPSGKRPYTILVAPVSRKYPVLSTLRPAICVVITDPEAEIPLPAHRLQSAFGLTAAEARLTALLAAGVELRTAAEKLGITYATARARLAEVFQKTGTRRQGELIQLVLTTLAGVPG